MLLVALGSPAVAAQPSGTFLLPGRERRCLLPELLLPLEQTGQLLRITACKLLFQCLDAAQTGGALGAGSFQPGPGGFRRLTQAFQLLFPAPDLRLGLLLSRRSGAASFSSRAA